MFSILGLQIEEYERSEFEISVFVRSIKRDAVEKKLLFVKIVLEKSTFVNLDDVKSMPVVSANDVV